MKPTGKQKKFADNYLRTLNKTGSALGAYNTDNPKVAHNLATRNLNNPKVQGYISEVLDRVGLGDKQLGEELKKIIKASTSRRSLKKTTPADGLRGIELSYKLKDRFPVERKQIETISLKLEGKSPKELQALLATTITEAQKYQGLLNGEPQQPTTPAPLKEEKSNKVEDSSTRVEPTQHTTQPRTKPVTL